NTDRLNGTKTRRECRGMELHTRARRPQKGRLRCTYYTARPWPCQSVTVHTAYFKPLCAYPVMKCFWNTRNNTRTGTITSIVAAETSCHAAPASDAWVNNANPTVSSR